MVHISSYLSTTRMKEKNNNNNNSKLRLNLSILILLLLGYNCDGSTFRIIIKCKTQSLKNFANIAKFIGINSYKQCSLYYW